MTFDDLRRLAAEDEGQLHVFEPSLADEELASWSRQWPGFQLPDDLVALLRRANGIHICAEPAFGNRAYEGLAPLREWVPARIAMWGEDAHPDDPLDDNFIAITYHHDRSVFVVLDRTRGLYFWMDSCGPDETCPAGRNADELLDFLWSHRAEPESNER